jgi:hypothetical protein
MDCPQLLFARTNAYVQHSPPCLDSGKADENHTLTSVLPGRIPHPPDDGISESGRLSARYRIGRKIGIGCETPSKRVSAYHYCLLYLLALEASRVFGPSTLIHPTIFTFRTTFSPVPIYISRHRSLAYPFSSPLHVL